MFSRIRTPVALGALSSFLLLQPATGGPAPVPTATPDDTASARAQPKADPAAAKFWQAISLLRSNSSAERTAGVALLQAAADLEYTPAQLELGNFYMEGSNGVAKNPRKAANLFRLAAERGNALAMVSLGICYYAGEGVGKDEGKAMQWLTAALAPNADFSLPTPPAEVVSAQLKAVTDAEFAGTLSNDIVGQRQAAAHFVLGAIYGRQKKLPEAQAHFVAAATAGPNGRSGIYMAAVAAAVNYAFGNGVPRDMGKASEMLDRSKALGTRAAVTIVQNLVAMKRADSFAAVEAQDKLNDLFGAVESGVQLNIAQNLADKKSKTYDLAEAAKWYGVAADNGQVWAMLPLAMIYARGELGHPEPEKAFQWFEKAGGGDKPKHLLATANLAICYQNGFGTPKDPEKAAALFKKWRSQDIVCYLGSIGQCPTAPLTYEEILALNETWAKKQNDPQAQYLLGVRYRKGWGVKYDTDEARSWFKKAAKSGLGDALNQLGETSLPTSFGMGANRAWETAVDYYQKAAAAGSTAGMANYAKMLLAGKGTPKDPAKAEAMYLQCVQLDPANIDAQHALGMMYEGKLREALTLHDDAAAATARAAMLEHYRAASDLGDALSSSNLGIIYYQGELATRDYRKAYAYFDDAAAHGSGISHYALGLMLEQGEGVPVSLTEAAYHYRMAALEGNTDALRRLINFYLTGQGVSLDLDQAAFWLMRMEVATGSQQVLTTYCDVLIRRHSYEDAVALLKNLRNSPDPAISGFACDRLSTCYIQGWGVKPDPAQGRKFHEQALKLGNGDALTEEAMAQLKAGRVPDALASLRRAAGTSRLAVFQLGVMYYNGENVPKDEAAGLKYLEAAAAANHTRALMFLANLTYHNASVAPTLDQAIQYAQRAETNGNVEAGTVREALEKRRREAAASPDEAIRVRSS